MPDLLSGPDSRFSFFNGLGATSLSNQSHGWPISLTEVRAVLDALFYDVYTQLAEVHLNDAGVEIEWSDVDPDDNATMDRWGSTREYFKIRLYRLPIGKMIHV